MRRPTVAPCGPPRHALPRYLHPGRADARTVALGALAVGAVGALVVLAQPLAAGWAAVAIAVRLAGGARYAVAVVRRTARPNIVTWFLWGVTPMIALTAQPDREGPAAAVTFALGLGPLVVAAVAFCTDRSASRLTPFTAGCAAASLAGIALWQLTAMPILAVAAAIVADLLATLPTLRKAYRDPASEYAPTYLLSVLAMLVTLGTVAGGDVAAYAFPLYMLLVNLALFAVAALPIARVVRRVTRPRPPRHAIPRGYRPAT